MIKCCICDKEFYTLKKLSSHLKIHKIISKNYYDVYLKNNNEGICPECKIETSFVSIIKGYKKYCNGKCRYNNIEFKEKIRQTCLERYGCENPFGNKEVQNKIKQTNLEKYGVENQFQSERIKEKIKQTNLEIYGFKHPNQNEEIRNKIKQTNIEKYGVENPFQSEEIKEKIKQTNLEKYGVDNISQNINIKDKVKKTNLNKITPKINKLLKYLNLELISEYNNCEKLIEIKCLKCYNIFETRYDYLYRGYGKCPICYPKFKSSYEIEILEYIKSIELIENPIINNRQIISPYELDIYIPDKNIAIEFDGLYWHSEEQGKDKNYHLNKTEKCLEKNIKLIHIFEDEWIYKKDIVKSRLKQILELNNDLPKISARKCEINEITSKEKNLFLNKYHLQGEDKSSIKLGAFYNKELISVMTFSYGNISKGSKNIEWIFELNRFCSNSNYHIQGIASKILTYFKRNYEWKEIYSYADRRWSDGNLYYKIGFKLDSITKPNYWYIKGLDRIHRFNLRKRSDEPKEIPEWILRNNEGYLRIWDCGHYKFLINNGEMNE